MNINGLKVLYLADVNYETKDGFLDTIKRLSITGSDIVLIHIDSANPVYSLAISNRLAIDGLLRKSLKSVAEKNKERMARLKRNVLFYMNETCASISSNNFDFMLSEGDFSRVIMSIYKDNKFDILVLANSFLFDGNIGGKELLRIIKCANYPVLIDAPAT